MTTKYVVKCFQILAKGHLGTLIYDATFEFEEFATDEMGGEMGTSLSIAVRAGMGIRDAIEKRQKRSDE